MDNTLFDFVAAKLHACGEVAGYLGRRDGEALFEYFLYGGHGFEHHENIGDYLRDRHCYREDVFQACSDIYEREKLAVLIPYPGIHRVLQELRDRSLRMAVLTDAFRNNALLRLGKLGLTGYFDHVVTADMTGTKKPALDPFLLTLRLLEIPARQTLLIGDSVRRDIAPGKLLGMMTAYARYGDRNVPSRIPCTPDMVFDSVEDMATMLPRIL